MNMFYSSSYQFFKSWYISYPEVKQNYDLDSTDAKTWNFYFYN